VVECREALALPAHVDRALVLRRIVVLQGRVRMAISFSARAGYGATGIDDLRQAGDGTWVGRTGPVHLRWQGGADARPRPDGSGGVLLEHTLELAEGDEHDLLLALGTHEDLLDLPSPQA